MTMLDLAFTSAIEQAHLIRTGEISPLELAQLYLSRIEQLDRTPSVHSNSIGLGSYVHVQTELVIAQARQMTDKLGNYLSKHRHTRHHSHHPLPPFFGVPIAIKDLDPVAGLPCSYGLQALSQNLSQSDSGIVTRIKQAGFQILGKTATSELGSTPFCEGFGFPPTRNPWNTDYTAGGSSGGSAAAVAAGLCAIAQGSDGGGSIRGPAACCGVVGIKPSRGRISWEPLGDRISGIATQGVLSRTVTDGAALLDSICGYSTGDPYWLPDPILSFQSAAERALQHQNNPLKIQVITEINGVEKLNPVCQNAVVHTGHLLANLGHHVESGNLSIADLITPFTIVWQSAIGESTFPTEWFHPYNQWLYQQSEGCTSGNYLRAVAQLQLIARRLVQEFSQFDVVVLPVFMHPPIQIGQWSNLCPEELLAKIIQWVAPCPPLNATGQPAIAIPVDLDQTGLPTSVQLVGRPGDEITIITLAAQLEQIGNWQSRRPVSF
ncbi:MAG: amidase [Synechococcales bacterium]|nr:amidase [Synechococcales bacterium]